MNLNYDVIIIGSGPAGIGAAAELRRRGIHNIAILEREGHAGGVPRHCQHPTFGVLVFKRPMKGNQFADKIVSALGDTAIFTRSTVIDLLPEGVLKVSMPEGVVEMRAKRILIATGVRETPRHPRLVSGLRPQGVLTAGALQQFVYLHGKKPCLNPVIVGSELVSFSALWTLKSAGVKALGMIESNERILAFKPAALFAKAMGTPVYLNSKITEIGGLERVEYVVIETEGKSQKIYCDAVIFTGGFVGENTLIRKSHLDFDASTGKPSTDQWGRCSDTSYYAAGNMLHPADMGDQCYQEGINTGQFIANDLLANHHQKVLQTTTRIPISVDNPIQFSVPACIDNSELQINKVNFNIKVNLPITGTIKVIAGNTVLYEKKHRCLPTRRILLKNIDLTKIQQDATEIRITVV